MGRLSEKDKQEIRDYSDQKAGELLRKRRNELGYELSLIAEELNLQVSHLRAIENNDIKKLPNRSYTLGFVKSYADFLGLEGGKVAYLYECQFYPNKESLSPLLPQQDSLVFISRLFWPVIFVFLGFLIYQVGAFFMLSSEKSAAVSIPEVPEEIMKTGDVNEAPQNIDNYMVVGDEMSLEAFLEPVVSDTLSIDVTATSWVEIRDAANDEVLMSRLIQPNETVSRPIDADFIISLGNVDATTVMLNGQELTFPLKVDNKVENHYISLDRDQNDPVTE